MSERASELHSQEQGTARRNWLLHYLAKCLQSHPQRLSFSSSSAASGYVSHKTHVLQMVIYEVHRGRGMGGASKWEGSVEFEEEEVLRRGRKQSTRSVNQSLSRLLVAALHVTSHWPSQFKAYM